MEKGLSEIQWLTIFRAMTKKEFKLYSNLVGNKDRAQQALSEYLEQIKRKYQELLL